MLLLANNSLLADSLVSILAGETDMDVVRLTHGEFGKEDQYSVVIIIDDEETGNESPKAVDLILNHNALLVITMFLKSRNIYVHECYQLVNPEMERVIHLLREFSRIDLKKKVEREVHIKSLSKIAVTPSFSCMSFHWS